MSVNCVATPKEASITDGKNPTGSLHLAYFASEITLHRCIIRSLGPLLADAYLSHVCRTAAKTRLISAMDYVNRLGPDQLSSFWYFPSKVNFALISTFGSLLLATAPAQEEADFYRTRLSEYRWTLCVSHRSAGFLKYAINSLDYSIHLLQNMPPKPSMSELRQKFPPSVSAASRSTPTPIATLSLTPGETIDANPSDPMQLVDGLPIAFRNRPGEANQLATLGGGGRGPPSSGLVSPSISSSSRSRSRSPSSDNEPFEEPVDELHFPRFEVAHMGEEIMI